MTEPTLLQSLLGGLLIGTSVSIMLFWNGKVAGISGIIGGMFRKDTQDLPWRALFLLGLLSGGYLLGSTQLAHDMVPLDRSYQSIIVAGLLVGFGTRLGGGCTSGHGVCGISRFSARSFAATLTFLTAGATLVYIVRHGLEGGV